MEAKLALVGESEAEVVCPECRLKKRVDIRRFKDRDNLKRIKFRCPCGNTFHAILERREKQRSKISYSGVCMTANESRKARLL